MMAHLASSALSEVDQLNPARALIMQGYYALRRTYSPSLIGTRQIIAWIRQHEPGEQRPSESLVQLTLRQTGVAHRHRGRPRSDSPTLSGPGQSPPFSLWRGGNG